ALYDLDLFLPEEWRGAVAFARDGGRTRHLVASVHGIAVVETDADALRDWPRGTGLDTSSAEEPPPGPAPAVRRPTGPLTAARVDDAFGGARHVVRIAESDLPEGLGHAGSRRYLRDVGLPAWWVCHSAQYETHPLDVLRPPAEGALPDAGLPDGVAAADLIAFGATDHGELYLHRHDGTVHIRSRLTRGGDEVLVLAELAPDLSDQDTATGRVWSWLYAGITELGVDGY
ncbi:SUKH-4 family immunity protein, partial [Streptomyces capoamus]|uniref:SUKH-4 family immunity protein n=1 Tax=Streptomyces capoamus TaxID=68183 RepID=UPI001E2FC29B